VQQFQKSYVGLPSESDFRHEARIDMDRDRGSGQDLEEGRNAGRLPDRWNARHSDPFLASAAVLHYHITSSGRDKPGGI
jgi:hypothetical protein